ncbi:hypothetical protein F2Q69_00061889 [Brassica cretica]|uniref:Uncharacterized protein n=1 Tax=Brassica cretica TaxID=69181 RepID=A0A8S9RJ69_BRACR|nr:hypothetical protein F2Q69_00061889 [Brassica cretica]
MVCRDGNVGLRLQVWPIRDCCGAGLGCGLGSTKRTDLVGWVFAKNEKESEDSDPVLIFTDKLWSSGDGGLVFGDFFRSPMCLRSESVELLRVTR